MTKAKKIRFLATGDFHSDLSLVDEIRNTVDMNSIDFVLFTGDLSDKKDDFKHLLGVFNEKQIFMVPGNHESKRGLELLKKHYKVHLIGNQPVMVDDNLAIFGTNYLSVGPYGIDEQEVFDNIVQNYAAIAHVPRKIHMNHIPPHETQIGDASPYPFVMGSPAVKAFLENFKPDVTLVGHIHETSGLEEIVNKTNVVNVGRTFKILEFDSLSKELKVFDYRLNKKDNKAIKEKIDSKEKKGVINNKDKNDNKSKENKRDKKDSGKLVKNN
jgi:hypothetical protein